MPYKDRNKQNAWQRNYSSQRNAVQQVIILEAKKPGCKYCGEMEPVCLDFHHRDPSMKSFTIGKHTGSKYDLSKLREEIAKCDILCRNCHAKVHAGIL